MAARNASASATIQTLIERLLTVQPGTPNNDPVNDNDPAHRASDQLRDVLSQNKGEAAQTLEAALKSRRGIPASRLGFLLSEHYAQVGDRTSLRRLSKRKDAGFRNAILEGYVCAGALHPDSLPLAIDAAMRGLQHEGAAVNATACRLVSQLSDATPLPQFVDPLIPHLAAADATVAVLATCAVGHLARKRCDVSTCVAGLRANLRRDATNQWAAWALAEAAKRKLDVSDAIDDLIWLLKQPHAYNEPIRYSASALLNIAKQSKALTKKIQAAVGKAKFANQSKLLDRFKASIRSLG